MKVRLIGVAIATAFILGSESVGIAMELCAAPNLCEARNRQGPRRQPDALDNFVAQLSVDANGVGVHVGAGSAGVGVNVGGVGVGVHTGAGGVGVGVGNGGVHAHVGVPDVDVDINTPNLPPLPCTGTGCITPPRPRQPPPPGIPPNLPGEIQRELATLSAEELALLITVCDSVRLRPESYSPIKRAICELLAHQTH